MKIERISANGAALTPRQVDIIACALRVAVEVYKEDAETSAETDAPRLQEQFERQARDAQDLLNWLV